MKAVVFGGTTEGRVLSKTLAAEGAEVIVSVASEVGAEEQGRAEGIRIEEGLKDEDQIRQMIRGADLVVDATHPYAVLVTENIRRAVQAEGIELLRLSRGRTELIGTDAEKSRNPIAADAEKSHIRIAADAEKSHIRIAADAEDAAGIALEAAGPEGNILLTTGSKDLALYGRLIPSERIFARVLPVIGSIEACEKAGIPHRNIIAIQGPFSEELNRAVLRDYEIAVMITKESGRAGGFLEKIRACEDCGVPAVVIARPEDEGLSFEEVLRICREKIK